LPGPDNKLCSWAEQIHQESEGTHVAAEKPSKKQGGDQQNARKREGMAGAEGRKESHEGIQVQEEAVRDSGPQRMGHGQEQEDESEEEGDL
jgi:hypothetical protein